MTPTGAGILAHLTKGAPFPKGSFVLRATGNGAGTRDIPGMPNILRAMVYEASQGAAIGDRDKPTNIPRHRPNVPDR